jgi:hypothetical protein
MQHWWKKSAILNIQKRNKTRYQVKNKINSPALKTSKIKQQNNKGFCFLFPRLVPFLGLFISFTVHTVYIQCETKVSWKCPTWGSPISWNFPAHLDRKFHDCKEFHESSVNLGCWIKSFVSITWVLHFKTVILSWNFRETVFLFVNKRFYHFTQHWPVLLYLMYFKTLAEQNYPSLYEGWNG